MPFQILRLRSIQDLPNSSWCLWHAGLVHLLFIGSGPHAARPKVGFFIQDPIEAKFSSQHRYRMAQFKKTTF